MMKKLSVISFLTAGIALAGCSDIKREPGTVYMPDMAYSRAFETYAEKDSAYFTSDPNDPSDKIFYNNKPVEGTMARGEEMPFPLAKDKVGDTANYFASKQIANPITSLSPADSIETERLYLVNCGICHGTKLDGNGPLYNDGKGPFSAAPAMLVGKAQYENMPAGQMFYSVSYGKNLMGSYASQLSRKQRWQIIYYIKSKQQAGKSSSAAPAATDSTAKK
jgi:mono/diheme cytochrome c family protein